MLGLVSLLLVSLSLVISVIVIASVIDNDVAIVIAIDFDPAIVSASASARCSVFDVALILFSKGFICVIAVVVYCHC